MKSWALPRRDSRDLDGDDGFDPLLTSLMRIQIGFDPKNISPQEPQICQKVLHRYRVLLYRYLKNKFGADSADQKFSEAMEMCDMARRTAEIVRRRLPV